MASTGTHGTGITTHSSPQKWKLEDCKTLFNNYNTFYLMHICFWNKQTLCDILSLNSVFSNKSSGHFKSIAGTQKNKKCTDFKQLPYLSINIGIHFNCPVSLSIFVCLYDYLYIS